MNDESDDPKQTAEQWAAFQKIWTDSFAKMMQLGFSYSPEAAPPEFLRQIRTGIFQALSQSWDQFLRSPQFMEGMKQWMEQAVSFRKMSNDFFTKVRHETQGTAQKDVDAVLVALQQLETRVLNRVEELAAEVDALKTGRKGGTPKKKKRRNRN